VSIFFSGMLFQVFQLATLAASIATAAGITRPFEKLVSTPSGIADSCRYYHCHHDRL
jgi:hypothetical protein